MLEIQFAEPLPAVRDGKLFDGIELGPADLWFFPVLEVRVAPPALPTEWAQVDYTDNHGLRATADARVKRPVLEELRDKYGWRCAGRRGPWECWKPSYA